jgi:hypothetical protein
LAPNYGLRQRAKASFFETSVSRAGLLGPV